MEQIYFRKDILKKVLKAIKEEKDLKDVFEDLDKIKNAAERIHEFNGCKIAEELDAKIRKKYGVDEMLNLANKLRFVGSSSFYNNNQQNDECQFWIERLRQDYYGILYDTALKKFIIKHIEDFVEKVE